MALTMLATYSSLPEANLVKAKLAAYGIDAVVEPDVASSSLPTFDQIEGVKVLVDETDLTDAREVLEAIPPPANG